VGPLNQRVVDAVLEAAEQEFLANNNDTATFVAELDLLGSILVTAGDFLGTISAAIVLRQIQIDRIKEQKDKQDQENQMKDIQDQLTALKNEIKTLRGR
jgi:hypothetical protein